MGDLPSLSPLIQVTVNDQLTHKGATSAYFRPDKECLTSNELPRYNSSVLGGGLTPFQDLKRQLARAVDIVNQRSARHTASCLAEANPILMPNT